MRKLALVVVVISACGNDSGSGSIPIDGLEQAAIDTFCDIYVRCGVLPDLESCRELYMASLSLDSDLIAAVHADKVVYHGDKARECYNAFTATSCDRNLVFGSRDVPLACDQTFVGTVGDAGQCALDEECISQDCQISGSCPANTCCMGTCVGGTPPARAELAQPCSSTIRCNTGYCDATTSVCTAFLADGAACTSSQRCNSSACSTTCQPLVATGGTCTTTSQCKLVGDVCNSVSKTCTPYGRTGDACANKADCDALDNCDAATSKCVAAPKVGASCTVGVGCALGSFCDTTTLTCTAPKPDGAACMMTTECASKHCDTTTTHTCVTPPVCI